MRERRLSIFHNYENYDSRIQRENLITAFIVIRKSREIIHLLVTRELASKYRRSILGIAWSLLTPIMTTSVIYFIFRGIFEGSLPSSRGYFAYVFSGLVIQTLVVNGIPSCASTLAANRNLISKVPVPPYIFSFATAITLNIQFMVSCLALIPILLLSNAGFTLNIFLLPIFVLFCVLFLSGVGMLLSGTVMRYDDGYNIITTVLMIISYLTPIFYSVEALPPNVRTLVELNPLTSLVSLARFLLLPDIVFDLKYLVVTSIFAISCFLLGLIRLTRKWNDWTFLA